jgi:hypothetical protein
MSESQELTLPIYTRRWGVENFYIARTDRGWVVRYQSGPVETDPDGLLDGNEETGIYDLLEREMLSIPRDLRDCLEWMWKHAAADELPGAVEQLGRWISACERESPHGPVFKGWK